MEGLLKEANGVGTTFIDMEETFKVNGLWVLPKKTGMKYTQQN